MKYSLCPAYGFTDGDKLKKREMDLYNTWDYARYAKGLPKEALRVFGHYRIDERLYVT